MRHILFFSLLLATSFSSIQAAPIPFYNAMNFDQQNFGLIDFEGGQSTITGINDYLSDYNAELIQHNGSYLGTASIGTAVPSYTTPISGTNYLGGGASSGSYITIRFNDPVESVGTFFAGLVGTSGSPYSNGVASRVRVTSGDGSVNTFDPMAYLPTIEYGVNGFIGVTDAVEGISEVQFIWNRDYANLDNIYFSNNTTATGEDGPTAVPFGSESSIPLPNYSAIPVPLPSTFLLGGIGLLLMNLRLTRKN